MPGIHHVTAISGDPVKNLRFYTRDLGLRFSTSTIRRLSLLLWRQDRSSGTTLTFFPWINAAAGKRGICQARMKSTPQSDCAPADDWTVFHGAGELQGIAHVVLTMQS
jgi:catechol 2,3-dioxygenase-like lactoylglutathione lyase family enzyme